MARPPGPFSVLLFFFRIFALVRAIALAASSRPYALGARIAGGILADRARAERHNSYRRRR